MIPTSPQAAVLTPRGRGAVAVIRVEGDAALVDRAATPVFLAANGGPLAAQPLGRIVFGRWGREAVEEVVACRVEVATWEIHSHGGDRAVARILGDLRTLGVRIVDWNDLAKSTADALAAELQEQLSRAITWRTAEYLLHQAHGGLRAAFQELAEQEWTPAGKAQAGQHIAALLNWAHFGIHLTQPWRVVLTGRPNVGKSSLINALLGYQRSIVFDQPGTTRDVVTAVTAFDGWPVQLIDTAGLRDAAGALEAEGIARARRQLADADLVVELLDLSEAPDGRMNRDHPADSGSLLVAHKCDLPDRWGTALPATALRVSSVTHAGLAELQREIVRRLIPELPELATPMPVTPRHVQLLNRLRDALAGAGDEAAYRRSICEVFEQTDAEPPSDWMPESSNRVARL